MPRSCRKIIEKSLLWVRKTFNAEEEAENIF
jgi:hypothetical protein